MKTTFKIWFRAGQKPSGKGKLVIRIIRRRKARTMTTLYEVASGEWDDACQKAVPLPDSSPQRQKELSAINGKLKKDLQLVLKTAQSLEAGGDYSSLDLVNRFRAPNEAK